MKAHGYQWIPVLLLLAVAGCTTNAPHRTTLPVTPTADTNRPASMPAINPTNTVTIEDHGNFKIGYVEFDDQGWFWSHQQWQAVKKEMETEATNSSQGLTVVVFVHGWKNDASYDNGNVEMFRDVLGKLSTSVYPRKLFGMYVGWRGLSVKSDLFPLPGGEEMSFYNRKAVAERIGHQGAATEVFTELQVMQEDLNQRTNVPPVELIIIGHSFGGQFVFSAISQVLIERLITAARHGGRERVKSLGDLVILLNPAFEASLYNNLISLATSPSISYPTNQAPVLAIFTSKSDWATGLAFPAGRFFSTLFEKTRPSKGDDEEWMFNVRKGGTADEKRAIRETIGHDEDYLTYDLNYTNYGASSPVSTGESRTRTAQSLQTALVANNATSDSTLLRPYIFANSTGSTNYACILQPRTNGFSYKRGNPFINAAVDARIMDGHNDINNQVMVNFLRDFILFTRTNYLSAKMAGKK